MTEPLAELHVHLEGSIEPATMAEIDPTVSTEEVRSQYRYQDFRGFLMAYKWVVLKLNSPEQYAIAAKRLKETLQAQGITHAEINLSVGVMVWRKLDARAIVAAIQKELGNWPLIFDAVRQFDPADAVRVAELASEFDAGFGVGGDESARPLSEFQDAIALAKGRFYPHAGETSNAASVWDALEHGARRIGHGIRALDDPALCRELRDRKVPLEISISSNVATGAVPNLEAHPVRRLFDLGVPVVLNTDDPAMFHTSLRREYQIAQDTFGFSDSEMAILRQNAFAYARIR